MKIVWTKSLVQSWFDKLTVYTGAEFNYSIFMNFDIMNIEINPRDKIFHFPVRRFNHVDVPDSHVLLVLTYIFGLDSDLQLSITQYSRYYTESVIRDICDNFNIMFLSMDDLEVQIMHIDRLLLNDQDSTRYRVGDRVMKKLSILMYTITDVSPLIGDKRKITLTSDREVLVLEEEDVIRNYHTI